jgi:hypothetical protein
MKLLFLIICLSTSFISYSDDLFEEEEIVTQYYKDYWESSDNINFQLSTYYFIEDIDDKFSLIKKLISKTVQSNPNKFTIYQVNVVCHQYQELTEFCHSLNIHQLHYKTDPQNINSYLLDLHNGDDEKHIKVVLSNALRNGTIVNSFIVDLVLNNKDWIKGFYNQYPQIYSYEAGEEIYDSLQDLKKEIINNNILQKGLIDETIEKAANHAQFLFMSMMISGEFYTSWAMLRELCQNNKYAKECSHISKTNIKSFGRVLIIGMMEFKWDSFKNSSKLIELNESVNKSFIESIKKRDKSIECYLNHEDVNYGLMFNNKLGNNYYLNILQHGELEASKRLSFDVYNRLINNGFKPSFNPNDCEQINVVNKTSTYNL